MKTQAANAGRVGAVARGRLARVVLTGGLALAACGGPGDAPDGTDAVATVSSALSSTLNGPLIGKCTTTLTLDKVVNASGATVMRAVCTETCKDKGKLTITSVAIDQRAATTTTVLNGPQVVNGTEQSLAVEMPYTPNAYQASCAAGWQNDNKGPNYVSPFIPATQF
ncbi:hypothetical protein KH5H1_02440 [Corallococcus caeni]|uniref:Lipoprotein n=1 Tax=Corallococcus caeni TaxID=3082388 RepID=A0ABQ6QVA7_9BACT|nr:hypothetical protein KH5H1_02440 [Corallococcus sp. KH5-1]GMU07953.1 hypothetical protein ASNO1_42060 [Corallococcus sp. NO1]